MLQSTEHTNGEAIHKPKRDLRVVIWICSGRGVQQKKQVEEDGADTQQMGVHWWSAMCRHYARASSVCASTHSALSLPPGSPCPARTPNIHMLIQIKLVRNMQLIPTVYISWEAKKTHSLVELLFKSPLDFSRRNKMCTHVWVAPWAKKYLRWRGWTVWFGRLSNRTLSHFTGWVKSDWWLTETLQAHQGRITNTVAFLHRTIMTERNFLSKQLIYGSVWCPKVHLNPTVSGQHLNCLQNKTVHSVAFFLDCTVFCLTI